jgi:hypothetical protein
MSKQLSFVVDDETIALLEKLKADLRAPTTASVLRRAIALAELAMAQAKTADGKLKDPLATVTIRAKGDPEGKELTVALRG